MSAWTWTAPVVSAPIAGRATSVAAVRSGWGVLLVAAPGAVLASLPGVQPTPSTKAVARVLGARQLTQGAAALAGSEIARRAWWVDALHAASMVALAAAVPAHRRLAAIDATIATAFATVTRSADGS